MSSTLTAASLKLNRNRPIVVQRAQAPDGQTCSGTLIGNCATDLLIVGGFKDVEFAVGDRIIVRMLIDDQAVGFQTTVKEIVRSPVHLYFLEYPEQVLAINLRKSERIKVFLPAEVRADKAGEREVLMLKTVVVNLSSGGCMISSKRNVEPKSDIAISFSLPGDKFVFTLTACVLDSKHHDGVFAQRARFSDFRENLPKVAEISKWIGQNLSFAQV
ncbi:MAG: PilZ domain-containing protein [Candidatus Lambdaproteobacteria bacterium]|nr:PilZ domain-containing protein [Candidatus Lambdaproteobacteria bacterium]